MEKLTYINSDAWNFWLEEPLSTYGRDELRRAVERDVDFYAVEGVKAVFYNMNIQRCLYDTKAGTPIWKDVSFDAAGQARLRGKPFPADAVYRKMYDGVTNMVKHFPEFMRYRYDYCHAKGVEMWHSFRVSDVHGTTLGSEWAPHADIWLDHKDCIRAWYRHTWRGEWPDGTLDYGNEKVYEHQLGLVRELLLDYPSDGIEFDWLRAAPIFKPGFDDFNRGLLTQFLRDVRAIADDAEKKWGHRIRMAHRVPARVRDAYGMGMDIAAWVRGGLVDVLMPGGCPATETEQDCEVILYRALAPAPVFIAAEIDCSVFAKHGWYESIDNPVFGSQLDAGFASNFYQQGADGIYFYNHFPRHGRKHKWVQAFFSEAADRQAVSRAPRRHPATYHVRCGESRGDESPFPYEIWPACCNGGVNINCGEGNEGRKARVVIGATLPLDIDILVNTVPCGHARLLENADGYPRGKEPTAYYFADIPAGTLHDGFNNVEIFNCGKTTITAGHLAWMEVSVD